jgi:RNA polymerase sigma-70 factor (ECF subfamily)
MELSPFAVLRASHWCGDPCVPAARRAKHGRARCPGDRSAQTRSPSSVNPTRPNLATPDRLPQEGYRARVDRLYRASHRRDRQVRACTLQDVSDAQGLDSVRRRGDEELIRLAAQLDAAAFGVLYERHRVPAFSLAVWIVGSEDQAQDVVRDAFLILWRDAGRYDPTQGTVRRWLMTMVHDRAIDAVRRLSRRDRLHSDPAIPLGQPAASDLTDRAARAQTPAIRDALQTLPEDQGRIVELAFYGGWTQGEIAEMLELPLSTVKSRARLGLLKLRDALLSQLEAPP